MISKLNNLKKKTIKQFKKFCIWKLKSLDLRHGRHMNNKVKNLFFFNFTFFFLTKTFLGFQMEWNDFQGFIFFQKSFSFFLSMKCFPTFCQSGFFISCLNSRQQRTKVFFSGNVNYRKLFLRRKKTVYCCVIMVNCVKEVKWWMSMFVP